MSEFRQQQQIDDAGERERMVFLGDWRKSIDEKFEKSEATTVWVFRILVTVVLGYVIKFVLAGGINV